MRRLLLLASIVALIVPNVGRANETNFGSSSIPCGNNGTIQWDPTTIWPPNHKLHTIHFTYSDPDNNMVSLTITPDANTDVVNGQELNGSGNTPMAGDSVGGTGSDTDGNVTVNGAARAERSGHSKDGRTYRFDYMASADGGADGCKSDPNDPKDDLTVLVPHDCSGGACRDPNA
jgi:hypothetical protein